MCDELIVGVHSDSEIQAHKRPPIMSAEERCKLAQSCRFVSHVVPDVPYRTSLDMMKAYEIDFAVHGDDITSTTDGSNSYQRLLDAGMMRYFPRTHGISTSDIISLLQGNESRNTNNYVCAENVLSETLRDTPAIRICEFARDGSLSNVDWLARKSSITLVEGAFDILRGSDVSLLRKVKEKAGTLFVCLHHSSESDVLSFTERCAVLAGCRFVDGIVSLHTGQTAENVRETLRCNALVYNEFGRQETEKKALYRRIRKM